MLARFRKDPLVGNVLALIALFIALGGGAYAAFHLPKNSVKSKHIVDGQVKTQDIAAASVDSSKLAPGSIQSELVPDDELIGADIDESTLGTVPNASDADLLDGKDSGQFQEVGSEGWTPLPLNDAAAPIACTWTSFLGGFADPSYFRDRDGVVHLRGVAKASDGSNQACGTIPIRRVPRTRRRSAGWIPPGVQDAVHDQLEQQAGTGRRPDQRLDQDGARLPDDGRHEGLGLLRRHQLPLRALGTGRVPVATGCGRAASRVSAFLHA